MLNEIDAQTAKIYEPIKEELLYVQEQLKQLVEQAPPEFAPFVDYVLELPGKRMRPAITLLCSHFHDNDMSNSIYMATAVEVLHLATLIHDDTVDNALLRRGRATASSRWGRQVAVLLGDYLFANSAVLVASTGNTRVMQRFAETIMELATGELMEHLQSYNWNQTYTQYEDRIYRKTASLFYNSAEGGAILSGAQETTVRCLSEYGRNLGMAFQVIDDILDFQGTMEETGKPVGNDLLQGVLTLPALMLIERQQKENPVYELFQNEDRDRSVKKAVELVHQLGILDECYVKAREFCDAAARCLDGFPDTPHLRSLLDLTRYVEERRH